MTARRAEHLHPDVAEDGAFPPAEADDQELTLAFQRGEDGSYQAIYDRCRDRVVNVCRRMLADRDDAEEAAQETFLRVYQGLARFNGRYELRAWATKIATNVCLDHLRGEARRPTDPTPVEILDLEPSRGPQGSDPAALLIRSHEDRRVRKLLWSLPPTHRAAIVLRDFEGLSYREIAIALELTEPRVKSLLHRARRGFRRSWAGGGALLLFPWRQLQRVINKARGVESTAEHSIQAAASNATIAQSCSTFVHSCGGFVGERVATIVTAAVVGTAFAGAGVVSTTGSDPVPPAIRAQVDGPGTEAGAASATTHKKRARQETATARSETPAGQESGTTSSAQPAPSSSPTPTATPTPSQSESPKNGGGTTPQPKPTPPPFSASLGFEQEGTIPPSQVTSHEYTADCKRNWVKQRLEATISDRNGSYPALLVLDASSSVNLELSVWKDGYKVYYSGGGALVRNSRSGDSLELEFNGSYGAPTEQAERAGLPVSGRFGASLMLDCATSSVVTESIRLSTG